MGITRFLSALTAFVLLTSAAIPDVSAGIAMAWDDDACSQANCPQVTVAFHGVPSHITADQFEPKCSFIDRSCSNPFTIVVSNSGNAPAASVLTGTSLLRITFSKPVAALIWQKPSGYSCRLPDAAFDFFLGGIGFPDDPGVSPLTSVDCYATADDVIAPGSARTFTLRIAAPSDVRHPDLVDKLVVTAELDPNEMISGVSLQKAAVARLDVDASPLSEFIPTKGGDLDLPPGGGLLSKTRVACSLGSRSGPPVFVGTDNSGIFGPMHGPMTCSIALRPADEQTSSIKLEKDALVFTADIDSLMFRTLSSGRGFACAGSTHGFQPHHNAGLGMECRTTRRQVIAPHETVPMVTFSAWLFGAPVIDWGLCLFLSSSSTPTMCAFFGGGASSE